MHIYIHIHVVMYINVYVYSDSDSRSGHRQAVLVPRDRRPVRRGALHGDLP